MNIGLKQIRFWDVGWINLALNRIQWQDVMVEVDSLDAVKGRKFLD
jgi:hypothetical protein